MKTKEELAKYILENWFIAPLSNNKVHHHYFRLSKQYVYYIDSNFHFYESKKILRNPISFEEVIKLIKKENMHLNFQ